MHLLSNTMRRDWQDGCTTVILKNDSEGWTIYPKWSALWINVGFKEQRVGLSEMARQVSHILSRPHNRRNKQPPRASRQREHTAKMLPLSAGYPCRNEEKAVPTFINASETSSW